MKPVRKALQKRVHAATPRFVLMLLWRLGIAHAPDATLAELTRNGTATTVILSPPDAELFKIKRGYSILMRSERSSLTPKLITPPAGDHPAYHHVMLEAIRGAVIEAQSEPERTFGRQKTSYSSGD